MKENFIHLWRFLWKDKKKQKHPHSLEQFHIPGWDTISWLANKKHFLSRMIDCVFRRKRNCFLGNVRHFVSIHSVFFLPPMKGTCERGDIKYKILLCCYRKLVIDLEGKFKNNLKCINSHLKRTKGCVWFLNSELQNQLYSLSLPKLHSRSIFQMLVLGKSWNCISAFKIVF